uniref:uncharacterized protein LOC122608929 n=1 Tax=Erigeron canadensis TaxID=72917 RepID=UPI001CB93E17|nr:uncharacterized protein LOC122608929 [Erigeron canadensis]
MSDHIANKIKEEVALSVQEEFDKRFPKEKAPETQNLENQPKPLNEKPYDLKNFTIASPPTYNGDPGPIVSTKWVNEIEGASALQRLHPKIRLCMGRLRSEFMNDSQGSLNVNEFRVRFLDKAQFCPEYLKDDKLLKEHFYQKLCKNIREKITLLQVESFNQLIDVERWHEVEQGMPDEDSSERKTEQSDSPNKKFWSIGSSGSNVSKRNIPTCNNCGKHHSGVCRLPPKKGCFNCGQPGHIIRDCKFSPNKPTVCFKCFNEGHMRSTCPLLTEEERQAEIRKMNDKKAAKQVGNPKGRSFHISVTEAKESTDFVSGTFLVHDTPAKILFDSGANRSFVATRFTKNIPLHLSLLKPPLLVEVAGDQTYVIKNVYIDCSLTINFENFKANLIRMGLGEFDVILGMDWLGRHKASM